MLKTEGEPSNHDLLIQLSRDICYIRKQLSNHLSHHWTLSLVMSGALLSGGIGAVIKWLL